MFKEKFNLNTLGDRIVFLRNREGLSLREVMEKLNISNLSRYEKNERKPNIDTFLTLSEYFKVTTDWLLKGTKNIIEDIEYTHKYTKTIGDRIKQLRIYNNKSCKSYKPFQREFK
jgi:transcriptional regulator with XRE-family HTH domain